MSNQRKPALLLVAGTLLTGFALAGCSHDDAPATPPTVVNTNPTPPPMTTTVTAPPGTTVTTPGAPNTKVNVNAGPGTSQGTDTATAEAVNKAIVTNKQMTGARVEAVVTDSVATLTGSVQNAQQKALAEKAAHDTTGVTSVKNKLQINPTGGAKSAAAPAPKTKIVVVHDKVVVPAPAPAATPAKTDASGTTDTSKASGTTSTLDTNGVVNTPTTAPTTPGSGQ